MFQKIKDTIKSLLPEPIVRIIQQWLGHFHACKRFLFWLSNLRTWPSLLIYFRSMRTGHIDRSHVCRSWDGVQPLRVTFVAGVGDMRVVRLAAAAQSVGIKVQLVIRRTPPHRDEMVDGHSQYFENIVWFEHWPGDLDKCLEAIHAFGSHLVHCHMQLDFNQAGVWLLAACDLPIVGDAYDMVNVQANLEHPDVKKLALPQVAWEKVWYQNAEGICFRSPYRKYMERKGIFFRKDAHFVHAPEPVVTERLFAGNKEDVVCNIMLFYWYAGSKTFFNRIKKCILSDNLKLFTINLQCIDGLPASVSSLPVCPYIEWIGWLQRSDAYVLVPVNDELSDVPRYTNIPIQDSFANRVIDVLENGAILVLPDDWRYKKNLLKKTSRVLVISAEDLSKSEFWASLPEKIAKLREKPYDFSHCNEVYIGQKLFKFYSRILGKPVA